MLDWASALVALGRGRGHARGARPDARRAAQVRGGHPPGPRRPSPASTSPRRPPRPEPGAFPIGQPTVPDRTSTGSRSAALPSRRAAASRERRRVRAGHGISMTDHARRRSAVPAPPCDLPTRPGGRPGPARPMLAAALARDPGRRPPRAVGTTAPMLELQQAAGNAAVARPPPTPAARRGPRRRERRRVPPKDPDPAAAPKAGTGATGSGSSGQPATTPPAPATAAGPAGRHPDQVDRGPARPPSGCRSTASATDKLGTADAGARRLDREAAGRHRQGHRPRTRRRPPPTAMESDADVKAQGRPQPCSGAAAGRRNRIAFMDYLGCSLGRRRRRRALLPGHGPVRARTSCGCTPRSLAA